MSGLLVGKTVAKMEILNEDSQIMTLTFTDGSLLCVVYKAYAPCGEIGCSVCDAEDA